MPRTLAQITAAYEANAAAREALRERLRPLDAERDALEAEALDALHGIHAGAVVAYRYGRTGERTMRVERVTTDGLPVDEYHRFSLRGSALRADGTEGAPMRIHSRHFLRVVSPADA